MPHLSPLAHFTAAVTASDVPGMMNMSLAHHTRRAICATPSLPSHFPTRRSWPNMISTHLEVVSCRRIHPIESALLCRLRLHRARQGRFFSSDSAYSYSGSLPPHGAQQRGARGRTVRRLSRTQSPRRNLAFAYPHVPGVVACRYAECRLCPLSTFCLPIEPIPHEECYPNSRPPQRGQPRCRSPRILPLAAK